MYFSRFLVNDLIEYVQHKKGKAQVDLYKELGIVNTEIPATEAYVSFEKMVEILQVLSTHIEDKTLGLHLGEEMSLKATAYVDNMMAASPTLDEAFQNAATYSKMISDAYESHLRIEEDRYIVSFEAHPEWALQAQDAVQQIIDISLVCTYKALQKLTGKNYAPLVIHLSYPKPKKLKEYYRIFNCSVKFNQQHSAIIFQRYMFKESLVSQDAGLLASLKKNAEIVLKDLQVEPQLVYDLKKIILKHKPDKVSVQEVAKELSLAPRTLQRKLKNLNTTFKEIEFDLQIRLAKNYLQHSEQSIDEISYILGFSESSAFIRFFKSMTQLTPRKYQLEQIKR